MSWNVEDPSRFGVILSDANGKILSFVEKPQTDVGSRAINAGHYIFNPSVIDRIQPVNTSIERKIFPEMASEGQLYVLPLQGFWLDIGTPSSFIEGISLFTKTPDHTLIDQSASIGAGTKIGPNVVIGPNVTIGTNSILKDCVIFQGSKIGNNVEIQNSIVGWYNKIGNQVKLTNLVVTGLDVSIGEGLHLDNSFVCPHKTITKVERQPTVYL